jgi:hypothetical protein
MQPHDSLFLETSRRSVSCLLIARTSMTVCPAETWEMTEAFEDGVAASLDVAAVAAARIDDSCIAIAPGVKVVFSVDAQAPRARTEFETSIDVFSRSLCLLFHR